MALVVTTLLWTVGLFGQAAQLPAGWQWHKSAKGGFETAFPGKPTEVSKKLERGELSFSFTIAAYRKGLASYSVATTELDENEGDPEPFLDKVRDATVKGLKGKLTNEAPCEFSGHPGRAVEIEIPKNVIAGGALARAQFFIVGKRLYELVVVLPSKTGVNPQDFDAFFKSFKPIEVPAAVKREVAKTGRPAAESKTSHESASSDPPSNPAPALSSSEKIELRIAKHRGWQVFTPKEGGMLVEFPIGTPLRDEFTHENSEFGRITVAQYKLISEGIVYQVTVEDMLGGRDRSARLQSASLKGRQGAMLLRGGGGRVLTERETTINGWPAREFEHEYTGKSGGSDTVLGIGKGRVVLGLKKEFSIQAIVPKGAQVAPADVDDFLNSLEVFGDAGEAAGAFAASAKVLEINEAPPQFEPGMLAYNDPAGAFRIMFPRPPGDPKVQKSKGPAGLDVTTSTWAMDDGPTGLHLLIAVDFPKGTLKAEALDAAYDDFVNSLLRSVPGKVTKTQNIRLVGFAGRDVEIAKPDDTDKHATVVHIRMVVVGNRLYGIARVGPRSLVELDGTKYIDSFRPNKAK